MVSYREVSRVLLVPCTTSLHMALGVPQVLDLLIGTGLESGYYSHQKLRHHAAGSTSALTIPYSTMARDERDYTGYSVIITAIVDTSTSDRIPRLDGIRVVTMRTP